MTWNSLLNKIQKMSPEQRKKQAFIFKGSSGSLYSIVTCMKAEEDMYQPECAPGERRYEIFKEGNLPLPKALVKKKEHMLII